MEGNKPSSPMREAWVRTKIKGMKVEIKMRPVLKSKTVMEFPCWKGNENLRIDS